MFWLGIDTGTGGTRALLADDCGRLVGACTAEHEEIVMQRPLWAEQRPENWWDAAQKAIRGVLAQAKVDGRKVRGIGLSGQMHGLVLLDRSNQVVRPALIWCDQRSQAQVDSINQTLTAKKVLECTANPVVTGFTLPKLLWVRDHEPAQFEKVKKILLPKDYIRFRLTGEYASDVSDASGTSMFDVVKRTWSYGVMDGLGLDRGMLPDVYESTAISGKLSADVAAELGLEAGVPVVAGAGDQAASAVGNGIVEPGIASCTLGTSGVVFAHMEEPKYDAEGRVHTFCHAVPGKWHVMGVTQGAGLSLQWLRNRLAAKETYDALTAEAATAQPGAEGLFWLPYLMGERTPHLDATARAAWVGLTAKHTRADLIRSVIEGVCYSQRDGLELIEQMGVPVRSVRVSGGGARSAFWKQLLSDILKKPAVTLATEEGSAYGAVLLAMVGTGAFENVEEACHATVSEVATLYPDSKAEANYSNYYAIYRAIYPALKPIYGMIA